MSQKQTALMLLVLICVLPLTGCSGPKPSCERAEEKLAVSNNLAVKPQPRPDEWWQQRHAAINERIERGNTNLLFVGDSNTQDWDSVPQIWQDSFGQWNPVNFGIRGDQTQHVLWRLENSPLENINPQIAIVMIGTNNSNGDEYTAGEIAEGIEAVVCSLRNKLPETHILLLSIFPRGSAAQMADPTKNAYYNPQWSKNGLASAMASHLTRDKMIHYLDINESFLRPDGVLTRDVMPDLLHLSEQGYQIWADAMLPTLEELMQEDRD